MTKNISHEWVIETLDKNGDVDDVNYSDTFPGVPYWGQAIGLVCDHDTDRSWAYIEDGLLPDYFKNAFGCKTRRVPMRFHNEVSKWWENHHAAKVAT